MKKFNILIGGYDLEQKIHRGIAFYAKALIKALDNNNLYLLTSAKENKEKIVTYLNILRQLDNPVYLSQRKKVIKYLVYLINNKKECLIKNNQDKIFETKLIYLKNINYFINKYGIYDITTVHNRFFLKKPMHININTKIDYFITTAPMNIKSNVPIIQTLHDIIPLDSIFHPPADDSKIFYYRIKNMLEYSDKIISVSNFSKNELLKLFSKSKYEDKIYVTHQPIPIYPEEEEIIKDEGVEKVVLEKFNLKKDNYIFYVGMLEKRKNIKHLIEAQLSAYSKTNIPLILAGGLGYGKEEFENMLNIEDRKKSIIKPIKGKYFKYMENKSKSNKKIVKYIGYINNIEKLVLMKNARAFVFPSYEEGFGLPPLEAMRFNVPVLTSNTTSLPEVCGNAALLINPYSLKEIIEGIVEIVNNEQLRGKLRKEMPNQIQKFSFENFRKKVENLF